ncbi:ABC transporter ATP-binding protein [Nocardioides sp. Kera G14]|uniref:ABC transporter ATP-binding protein n=1 Tax=Nocardioides sp. Kera G14 TaxID=2884264 RepID=UPI001D0FC14C|nr:ABC transporter ATP-binding protein [Nocardioides sp. Kera G14]UDY23410.1 ABC transporter ATP-binding protein [Nocardioides sp. Kera G14]
MTPLLRVDGLSKRFGAVVTADGISFEVPSGGALAVLGPNGAGKSTLLSMISGALKADAGTITYDGHDLTHVPAARRSAMGIARTFQVPRPFSGMTVFENVLVAASFGGGQRGHHAYERAASAIETAGMGRHVNEKAGALRLLDRKRLELARALATEPKLILLDEIAGGLSEHELPELIQVLKTLKAEGVTIVWIEHVVHALNDIADSAICLAGGEIIARGGVAEVMAHPKVVEVYLGAVAGAGDLA